MQTEYPTAAASHLKRSTGQKRDVFNYEAVSENEILVVVFGADPDQLSRHGQPLITTHI